MIIDYILIALIVINLVVTFLLIKSKKGEGASEELKFQILSFKDTRTVLLDTIKIYNDNVNSLIGTQTDIQRRGFESMIASLEKLTAQNNEKLERIGAILERKIADLQHDNSKKLEEMRITVDEKLNESIKTRFNESFNLISQRLEAVHNGLGEMKQLASGVGDLKKVLTNIKTRGTWGEVQLNMLLEQMLAPSQFIKGAQVKQNSQERVDFAIIMPGRDEQNIMLPIDAKFPIEDYLRLCEASDINEIKEFKKAIERRIKEEAKSIKEKYINPPETTDFAVLYLPIEGL